VQASGWRLKQKNPARGEDEQGSGRVGACERAGSAEPLSLLFCLAVLFTFSFYFYGFLMLRSSAINMRLAYKSRINCGIKIENAGEKFAFHKCGKSFGKIRSRECLAGWSVMIIRTLYILGRLVGNGLEISANEATPRGGWRWLAASVRWSLQH
jgi:hypothetical protein